MCTVRRGRTRRRLHSECLGCICPVFFYPALPTYLSCARLSPCQDVDTGKTLHANVFLCLFCSFQKRRVRKTLVLTGVRATRHTSVLISYKDKTTSAHYFHQSSEIRDSLYNLFLWDSFSNVDGFLVCTL